MATNECRDFILVVGYTGFALLATGTNKVVCMLFGSPVLVILEESKATLL